MSSPHLTSWMKVCVHVELHYSLYQLCFLFLRFCVILNKSFFIKDNLTTNCVVFAIRVVLLISKFGTSRILDCGKADKGFCH